MSAGLISIEELALTIDHSLLRPDLTTSELRAGCALARRYGVVSVCVRPSDLPIAAEELTGSRVLLTTTVAFPHGVTTTAAKVAEAIDAIGQGAVEVDMVMNYARLRSGEPRYVRDDVRAVADAAHARAALVKVILETSYLGDDEKVRACQLAEEAGADFVKTSTGYGKGGATAADVALMRRTVGPRVRVKAAGGVTTLDAALEIIAAGAVRIGTRSTEAILDEARARADASGHLPLPSRA